MQFNFLITSLNHCEEGHGFVRIQKHLKNGKRGGTECYTCHCERKLRWRSPSQRFVKWANPKTIAEIYETARKSALHVDHIVPLRGDLVSGLHVEDNMQLLTPEENNRKNKFYRPD